MNIVLTGSLGNIGKPLTPELVKKGHSVTVISSSNEKAKDIKALGATPAIGRIQDVDFLTRTFNGADIVYLMETMEAVGDMFDKSVDFIGGISAIGENYKEAVSRAGVKNVIHLSSIGADMKQGNGILAFHHNVETILRSLPEDVAIKFIRPVGFYINMMSFIHTIKSQGAIISNYGGDMKEPWVSPTDIASVIAAETGSPFQGRTVRYVASDEISPNEIASAIGQAIGKPDLQWKVITDEQLLNSWLKAGFNEQIAKGFVELQAAQGDGSLYVDYYNHKPELGLVKLKTFVKDFAAAYNES
ncbi:MAG: NmrA family NAD(P)-binding protein [Cyclobacteriaceae bacterium]|nr:NmrA family NAD(P)-binding protein [Cyclobacteriaceae bacterium]